MISFTVRMKFRSDDRTRVAELLTALAKASRQEPGCVSYIPHTVDGEPDTVVIYEQYADQKAWRRIDPRSISGLGCRRPLPDDARSPDGEPGLDPVIRMQSSDALARLREQDRLG